VKINIPIERYYAIELAKAGYYGGDVEKILTLPASLFMEMLSYEEYLIKMQNKIQNINSKPQ